MVYLKT
ncbi:hypothetical protein VCHC78A1_03326A, partial [Vibrio cholerae HC-78A1]